MRPSLSSLPVPIALPHCLPAWRLDLYARLLVLMYMAVSFLWFLTEHSSAPGATNRDFFAFWSAAKLSAVAAAVDVYEPHRLNAMALTAVTDAVNIPWFYPPTFLVLVQWLDAFSYPMAFMVFTSGSLLLFACSLFMLSGSRRIAWYGMALPFVFITGQYGQNGLFLAALVAGAARLHQRHPFSSGLLLGMLCIKPHLFLPLGLFIVWKGHRRMVAGALTSVLVLMAVATVWFSPAVWGAFLHSLELAFVGVEQGYLPWLQMSSLFSGLRQWGLPIELSHLLQLLWGLCGLLLGCRLICLTQDWRLHWAIAISCGLMVSPFLYQYDLVLLAVPMVLLVMCAKRDGLASGQAWALLALGLLPALDYFNLTHINWLLPLATLGLCWHHMRYATTLQRMRQHAS